jgi:hypothetical protein
MYLRVSMIVGALLIALVAAKSDDQPKKAGVPPDLKDKVKHFVDSLGTNKTFAKEDKGVLSRGTEFYGKPYFLGTSDYGDTGFFTFWLINPKETPVYRAYSVDITKPTGQAIMKTVLFGFEQKAQWIVVYPQADDPYKPRFVTVYP